MLSKSKKRGIDEVDSVEVVDHLKMLARRRGDSLMGPAVRLTTDAMQIHTQNSPADLAGPGSPTERNTPTPEPEMVQNSQKSNQSFSDLLDYGMCASQKSEHGIPLESASKPTPKLTPIEARKARAEQLRTRLKFGLYKITTNQVGKRDAEIISTFESRASYSSGTRDGSRTTTRAPYTDSHRVPNITISSPRRDADVVLIKANLDPYRPISKLGAAPVLFPPPSERNPDTSPSYHTTGYDAVSYPPGVGLAKSVSPQQLTSPARPRPNPHTSPVGAYDDTDMHPTHASPQQTRERWDPQPYLDPSITASAVKDNAAEGLIELMSSTR